MDFFALIDSALPYLAHFDYDHYPENFAAFEESAAPFFDALDPACFEARVGAILDGAAARWEKVPRLARRGEAKRDKTVLALFFTPAAARHSETARAFAALLQARWNSRFPRNRYLAGDYDALLKGFDTDFFGITLRKTKRRE